MAIDLQAGAPLLLNASHAFLHMMVGTAAAWQRDLQVGGPRTPLPQCRRRAY